MTVVSVKFSMEAAPEGDLPDAPESIALDTNSDAGVSNSDNITNLDQPEWLITANVEEGWFINTYVDGDMYGDPYEVQADEAEDDAVLFGNLTALPSGTYLVTFSVENDAGEGPLYDPPLSITIDTTAPTVASSTPADDATDVAPDTSIVLTFSKNVAPTDTVDISLRDASDDSVIESFDETDIGGALEFVDDTLTITPSDDLPGSAEVTPVIDNASIIDVAGNAFAGLESGDLSFTIEASILALGTFDHEIVGGGPVTTFVSSSMDFPAGVNVIGVATVGPPTGGVMSIVSVKLHSPDFSTDPTGTAVTFYENQTAFGSSVDHLSAIGTINPGSDKTGVLRVVFNRNGYLANCFRQHIVGAANPVPISSSDLYGVDPDMACPTGGVIVAVSEYAGAGVTGYTWTGLTEIFDENIGSTNQWGGAATTTAGTAERSYTGVGLVSSTGVALVLEPL